LRPTHPSCTNNGAEEQHSVNTSLSSTTLSGYVDTSALWSSALPLPPNDNFASAALVQLGEIRTPDNLTAATLEQAEPANIAQTGSVWYRWNIPVTGLARISTWMLSPFPPAAALSYAPALSDPRARDSIQRSLLLPGHSIPALHQRAKNRTQSSPLILLAWRITEEPPLFPFPTDLVKGRVCSKIGQH
jgi:hypothetical protein